MLTARENMLEVIKGGNPDRVVNQYEALSLTFNAFTMSDPFAEKGTTAETAKPNKWGIYNAFPENTPGQFPVQDDAHLVIKDIENWQDYVKVPDVRHLPEELWAAAKGMYDAVDKTKSIASVFVAPGLFEQCHHMATIEEVLIAMYESPDELKDLIKALTEFELELADEICTRIKPESIFHHDDWGSQKSTFMSPAMFEEFFAEPYQQIYGYYHQHGVDLVVHHSDSYAATLVPAMIDMGIDVWQGAFSTNDIPELIKKYGGKISFMGGIENCLVDFADWSEENNRNVIRKTIEECGNKYFIPCIAQGGPGSVFPGVYKSMWDEIDKYNIEKYGATQEELDANRVPISIMF